MTVTVQARDRLQALLEDAELVSSEQRNAVKAEGDLLLVACPGSGKTRTVGLRSAWWGLSDPPRKVAATSYTNVAVAEIRVSASEAGLPLGEPHFCGTLHSLLLRLLFYPFGHLFMGCAALPRVLPDGQVPPVDVNDVWLGDNRFWAKVGDFHYRPDGTFSADTPQALPLTPEQIVEVGSEQAHERKAELFRQGYASFSDSMYIAMKVLEEHPDIAALVAARFDEIIVDEVQDTSAVQLRCLALLRATSKLASLVMVGDPDQAIYEWQGSDPEACRVFAASHGLRTLELTRNFRSSEAICGVTHRLSSRSSPEEAAGPFEDFGVVPEVFVYDPSDLPQAVAIYRERLDELGIDHDLAPVLVRNRTLAFKLNRIGNVSASWQVRALGDAAAGYAAASSFESQSLNRVEDALQRLAWGVGERRDMAERVLLRDVASRLISALPVPAGEVSLRDWIGQARTSVANAIPRLSDSPVGTVSNVIRARSGDANRRAADVFPTTMTSLLARTVHSAKGESHDAVLLLAGRAIGQRDSARDWIKAELGEDRDEETRIAYVGLTRARKYCAVAVPDSTHEEVIDAYQAAGFSLRSTT